MDGIDDSVDVRLGSSGSLSVDGIGRASTSASGAPATCRWTSSGRGLWPSASAARATSIGEGEVDGLVTIRSGDYRESLRSTRATVALSSSGPEESLDARLNSSGSVS